MNLTEVLVYLNEHKTQIAVDNSLKMSAAKQVVLTYIEWQKNRLSASAIGLLIGAVENYRREKGEDIYP
jgi:hypothetical protein